MPPFNRNALFALAGRTFRHAVESPVAYVVAIFFYGFVGSIFAGSYFRSNHASITDIAMLAPWGLLFVIPALTMGLLSEELRSGTFETLSTLPLRDWEIVVGKFMGYAALSLVLVSGLGLFAGIAALTATPGLGIDGGATLGVLVALYLLCLTFGAFGLFASSLTKNPVVALIVGSLISALFFFLGQFYSLLPGPLARLADFIGVVSHMDTLAKGVFDLRDLFYFCSLTGVFLYLAVQRLSTRRF